MAQKDYKLEIVNELLKGENHVRNISKIIKTNHMNISRKIKELSKENVVDYRIEGKNKKYFLKKTSEARSYAVMAESYKLIKILEKYPSLRSIIEKIQKNNNLKLVILFGSYAKGLAKQESDIDIYAETIDRKIKQELESLDSRLSVKIGEYSSDNLLIKEIVKNHVVIKGIEEYYGKNKLFS